MIVDIYSDLFSDPMKGLLKYLTARNLCPKFEDRNATDSWLYDGTSIALYGPEFNYLNPWDYDRSIRLLSEHELLHEICHWICVSDVDQRYFPEYGLKLGVPFHYAVGTLSDNFKEEFIGEGGKKYTHIKNSFYIQRENIIDKEEQITQEYTAAKVGWFFGTKFSLNPNIPRPGGEWESWEKVNHRMNFWIENSLTNLEIKFRFEYLVQKFV